jgi:hypothetical protein
MAIENEKAGADDDAATTTTTHQRRSPLKGVLRMLEPQYPDPLSSYSYDETQLMESHALLQNRRKRSRPSDLYSSSYATSTSFPDLIQQHRFVGVFFTQGGPYFSPHELSLRKILTSGYHDSMTLFVVFLGGQQDGTFLFGSGFSNLPPSSILTTVLNVTKLPTLVVIDSETGRPISQDESLAVKWNEPRDVLASWEEGRSGLSLLQKAFALLSFT